VGPLDVFLTLILLGLGIYFSILVAFALSRYLLFRRLRPTALLTWPGRSRHLPLLVALGILSLGVAVLNGSLRRPFHHVYSQGVMAAYFILMVPLLSRIHLGLYEDGVWADPGFLPYGKIGRMAFVETPEIVLVMLPRGGSRTFRLLVPPGEYGAVRKVLEEKIRNHVLKMEEAILGL
jgi:hypothetical protein